MTVTAQVETIDPARATELLGEMLANRNMRTMKVRNFATDIAAGGWYVNGEAIKIDVNNKVADGEHRLQAIILADKAIETLMVYGVEPKARITMDTGTARTLADHLKLNGEIHCTTLAAALSVIHCRELGDYLRQSSPSHLAAVEMLEANPDLRISAAWVVDHMKKLRGIPKGLSTVLHYETHLISEEDAEAFWHKLATGEDLHARSPIKLLRDRLALSANHASTRLTYGTKHAIMIKAWNNYVQVNDMGNLRFRGGGAHPEAFPQIEGPVE